MNKNIEKLFAIAQKKERRIIGLMSGTSLDGLDIALCRFSGNGLETKVTVEKFTTISFNEAIKEEIRKVFSKETVNLQHLTLLNAWIANLHASLILDALNSWYIKPEEVDLLASHGQTIYHAPKSLHRLDNFSNATLQIGDGDHLSVKTGIITFSDFRQKHIAVGGEGAPLAVYGDYLLFSKKNEDRIMLNIGGIANFTYLPGDFNINKIFSTDVGPGNTLIDAFTRKFYPEKAYDKNGIIGARGKVNESLLNELKSNTFFTSAFPKTTGPELFNINYVEEAQIRSNTKELLPDDLIATLTKFAAQGIADAIKRQFPKETTPVVYTSGGGMHNPTLINFIREEIEGIVLKNTGELSILPDAKEAVLFATLANESIAGDTNTIGKSSKSVPNVFMGKISFPY